MWYAGDNKISYENPEVVTEVIDLMKKHFGNLIVKRGNKHRFLGMNITIYLKEKIEIEMKDQLEKAVDIFTQSGRNEITKQITSPATRMLIEVNSKCETLSRDKWDIFHSIVAKLLWIIKRARPDLETTISYLYTRVTKYDTDNWRKSRRLIVHMKSTINDIRIIGATDLKSTYTWIYTAYAMNSDMRSQTGGVISLGLGVLYAKCAKQKLNVKSSTKAELVETS